MYHTPVYSGKETRAIQKCMQTYQNLNIPFTKSVYPHQTRSSVKSVPSVTLPACGKLLSNTTGEVSALCVRPAPFVAVIVTL